MMKKHNLNVLLKAVAMKKETSFSVNICYCQQIKLPLQCFLHIDIEYVGKEKNIEEMEAIE